MHKKHYNLGTWARGYKTVFMLNSAEHEISNAHKYKNIKKLSIFQAQTSLECYFSCSLSAFQHLSAGIISCSTELSMKKVL